MKNYVKLSELKNKALKNAELSKLKGGTEDPNRPRYGIPRYGTPTCRG